MKLYRGSMQKVPSQRRWLSVTWELAGRAVERVADNGMSQRRQVHADLVGPAGFKLGFEQGESGFGL
jgi:CubicO group peptidase (beta-lactamase class C family)